MSTLVTGDSYRGMALRVRKYGGAWWTGDTQQDSSWLLGFGGNLIVLTVTSTVGTWMLDVNVYAS